HLKRVCRGHEGKLCFVSSSHQPAYDWAGEQGMESEERTRRRFCALSRTKQSFAAGRAQAELRHEGTIDDFLSRSQAPAWDRNFSQLRCSSSPGSPPLLPARQSKGESSRKLFPIKSI